MEFAKSALLGRTSVKTIAVSARFLIKIAQTLIKFPKPAPNAKMDSSLLIRNAVLSDSVVIFILASPLYSNK